MDPKSGRALSIVAYATCAAILVEPATALLRGRLAPEPAVLLGLAGYAAVPLLFLLAHLCPKGEAPSARTRWLTLLQAPAALLAVWGLRDDTMAVLLVLLAAQLPPRFPMPAVVGVLLAANAGLALIVNPRADWAGLGSLLLAYGSFQAFAVLVVSYARSTEAARDELLRINAELRATRMLLMESARSEERLRLSRELHDVAGHSLTALKLQLQLCARSAPAPMPEPLDQCLRLSDELLAEVRGVVGALRTGEGIDLHEALAALVPALPRPQIRLELGADARVPGVEQAQALLRCAQEGLTNALRHSDAEHIVLRLARGDGGVNLVIEDDGSAQAPPRWGHGLTGMQERLQALGGVLEVAVAAGHGLRVRAWLPQAAGT